jgi:hypothetical protein
MRVIFGCAFVAIFAAGIALSQDTNFSNGPQYLLSSVPGARSASSDFFVRSISTPSVSLSGPALEFGASNATGDLNAGAETQTIVVPEAVALPKADLSSINYGVPTANVIEISFPAASGESIAGTEIPQSILDIGVGRIMEAQYLRESDNGVTLPEAAAYGKEHIRRAMRIYTNADIDRLHGGM